jgi:hypothetical protein
MFGDRFVKAKRRQRKAHLALHLRTGRAAEYGQWIEGGKNKFLRRNNLGACHDGGLLAGACARLAS